MKHLRKDVGEILRMLCERKGIKIIEAEICSDYVHIVGRNSTKNSYIITIT